MLVSLCRCSGPRQRKSSTFALYALTWELLAAHHVRAPLKMLVQVIFHLDVTWRLQVDRSLPLM